MNASMLLLRKVFWKSFGIVSIYRSEHDTAKVLKEHANLLVNPN
jgi:hypothetical protein